MIMSIGMNEQYFLGWQENHWPKCTADQTISISIAPAVSIKSGSEKPML
jgi:hypothetical protein